ncbi:hypothetical protein AOQ84DRAFT_181197 [Glonium stellatum]|uniref:Uncharacterized protein n=1 Tax=Glonium stellatum TaxID=574774 RepID=A0A8E2EQH3_9PEZI|nr:hypothetical protein AOQ84DRAFT_181197 [Glonium stellatum]
MQPLRMSLCSWPYGSVTGLPFHALRGARSWLHGIVVVVVYLETTGGFKTHASPMGLRPIGGYGRIGTQDYTPKSCNTPSGTRPARLPPI